MKSNLTILVIVFIIAWATVAIISRINDKELDRRLDRIELLIGLDTNPNVALGEGNLFDSNGHPVGEHVWNQFTYTYTFEVVDARRLQDCTYRVGLKDQDGLYFVLIQDLVSFSAMGVDCNQILKWGEL